MECSVSSCPVHHQKLVTMFQILLGDMDLLGRERTRSLSGIWWPSSLAGGQWPLQCACSDTHKFGLAFAQVIVLLFDMHPVRRDGAKC